MESEYLRFDINGEQFEATPDNTYAYTFTERDNLDRYDHFFLFKDPATRVGAYVFKIVAGEENFYNALNYMAQNDYFCLVNQPRELLSQSDIDAYNRIVSKIVESEVEDLGDYPPDFT